MGPASASRGAEKVQFTTNPEGPTRRMQRPGPDGLTVTRSPGEVQRIQGLQVQGSRGVVGNRGVQEVRYRGSEGNRSKFGSRILTAHGGAEYVQRRPTAYVREVQEIRGSI